MVNFATDQTTVFDGNFSIDLNCQPNLNILIRFCDHLVSQHPSLRPEEAKSWIAQHVESIISNVPDGMKWRLRRNALRVLALSETDLTKDISRPLEVEKQHGFVLQMRLLVGGLKTGFYYTLRPEIRRVGNTYLTLHCFDESWKTDDTARKSTLVSLIQQMQKSDKQTGYTPLFGSQQKRDTSRGWNFSF